MTAFMKDLFGLIAMAILVIAALSLVVLSIALIETIREGKRPSPATQPVYGVSFESETVE